jgi:4-hydroxyphenylacetate 3-monooxygenase
VTIHEAFRNSVRSAARLYDFQADPAHVEAMTFASPDSRRRVSRCWQLPRFYAELVERRRALEAWAGLHFGFMGRSPDHVASCISGLYMGLDLFEAHDRDRAAAVRDYYRYARDNDLFLTYVIINPQADRSKAAHAQADPFLAAGVVDEDAAGLTIRGAKMLATSGIMANEVFVTCIQPLAPGDEKQAVSFAIPMNVKGLRVLSRKSYEQHAVSRFDNPLSSRFDENDAVLYFDDVKVPWERVFVNQDIDMTLRQFHGTPAHVFQNYQCQIRLLVKPRFLAGIAHGIAEANGIIGFPQVRETLGQIAAEVGLVDGLVHGMEAKGSEVGDRSGSYFVPDRHLLYTAQTALSQDDHDDPRTGRRRPHHGPFQRRRFR